MPRGRGVRGTVAVTGGAGFVGSFIVQKLRASGYSNIIPLRKKDFDLTHEAEVDRLYQIWDTTRDARCEYYYIHVRRGALKKLRDAVGEEAYYSGTLPPHVPVWRFARID